MIQEDTCIPTMSLHEQLCLQFSVDEIKEATNNFDDELIIGKGGFGLVYLGVINNGAKFVAIKRLRSESQQGDTEFLREIETLSKLQHDNLVRLEGYCNEAPEKILVYEYMPNGSLVDHLYKSQGSVTNIGGDNQPYHLTWEERLNISIGAAQGLDFLHREVVPGVIHRDIKDSNILLDSNLRAKIGDFGLAKLVKFMSGPQVTCASTTIVKGTFGYVDPEYLNTQRLTTKTDVYAFGVVLLVVLSGRPAVDHKAGEDRGSLAEWATKCITKNRVDLIIDPYLVGKIPSKSLQQFVEIIQKCLCRQPEQRPSMEEVVVGLQLALREQPTISGTPSNRVCGSLVLTQMAEAKLIKIMTEKHPETILNSRLEVVTEVEVPNLAVIPTKKHPSLTSTDLPHRPSKYSNTGSAETSSSQPPSEDRFIVSGAAFLARLRKENSAKENQVPEPMVEPIEEYPHTDSQDKGMLFPSPQQEEVIIIDSMSFSSHREAEVIIIDSSEEMTQPTHQDKGVPMGMEGREIALSPDNEVAQNLLSSVLVKSEVARFSTLTEDELSRTRAYHLAQYIQSTEAYLVSSKAKYSTQLTELLNNLAALRVDHESTTQLLEDEKIISASLRAQVESLQKSSNEALLIAGELMDGLDDPRSVMEATRKELAVAQGEVASLMLQVRHLEDQAKQVAKEAVDEYILSSNFLKTTSEAVVGIIRPFCRKLAKKLPSRASQILKASDLFLKGFFGDVLNPLPAEADDQNLDDIEGFEEFNPEDDAQLA